MRVSTSRLEYRDRCHFAYDLKYRQGWTPRGKTKGLYTGTAIHSLLAIWYTTKKYTAVKKQIVEWMESGEDPALISLLHKLFDRYCNDFAPFNDTDWEIVAVEKKFSIPLITPKGVQVDLEGVLDLVVKIAGRYWLVEHKSHFKNPWSQKQADMAPQPSTYCAALKRAGYDFVGVIYNLLNTYEYKDWQNTPPDKLFQRIKTHRTPVELENFLLELYRQVEDIEFNGSDARRSLARDCDRCEFQEPCLLSMKGIPIQDLLEMNFDKIENRESVDMRSQSS